jgi:hypothetical protein
MLEGGQMGRDCGTCKKNNNQKELACGYLAPEERSNRKYVAPFFQDVKLVSDVCPVYVYLENIHLYEYLNMAKRMSPLELSYPGRVVIDVYNRYMSLKEESVRPKKGVING